MPDLLRVFLDANILFSASFQVNHRFLQLWRMRDLIPVTSMYTANEVHRNCVLPALTARFAQLLEKTDLVSDIPGAFLPRGISLPAKDAPILAAAVHAGADYLITGDRHHFGKWMRFSIPMHLGSLIIEEPSCFLAEHRDRL